MQGLIYTARFSSTESAAQDLFSIGPVVTPNMIIIHEIRIGQHTLSGDFDAEMAEIQLARAAAVGTGGTVVSPAPRPHMPGAPAATVQVQTSHTTPATSPDIIHSDTFNIQGGWCYLPATYEDRIIISSSPGRDIFVCTLPNVVSSAGFAGSIIFEEILG